MGIDKVLIGLYQPTSRSIWLRGKKVKIDSPKTAVKLGIGMVHQHFMPVIFIFHKMREVMEISDRVIFTIGKGEVVGVAGVDGNGQSQLAQLVTGVIASDSGEVDLNSRRVAQFAPNGFILSISSVPL